jgi:predicted GNAT family acetyltransferase
MIQDTTPIPDVVHNTAARRFEIGLDGKYALIQYRMRGDDTLVFTHTEVPPEFEGRGIAGKIAKVALDYAKNEGLTVEPLCPYVATYIKKHAEYQDLVK